MDAATWQTIGTIVALLAVGAYNAWRTRRAEHAATQAAQRAQHAVTLSAPTGNGFAGEVKSSLERIEAKVDDVAQAQAATHRLVVDHLQAHAQHDLKAGP